MKHIVSGTTLVIPEGTKTIGFNDIASHIDNNSIEEVLLPSTLEAIEADTFFDFTELKKINIPKSVTKIGSQAFWGLDGIKELVVPSTVKRIEKHAFCNMSGCKLIIVGEPQSIPAEWDAEFAANVKEIRFVPKV